MLFTVVAPDVKVTVGEEIGSEAVKVKVTRSPGLAFSLFVLSEAIETLLKVGAELSIATLVPSEVAVTAVPALPIVSLNETLKVTGPFVLFTRAAKEAVQVFSLIF